MATKQSDDENGGKRFKLHQSRRRKAMKLFFLMKLDKFFLAFSTFFGSGVCPCEMRLQDLSGVELAITSDPCINSHKGQLLKSYTIWYKIIFCYFYLDSPHSKTFCKNGKQQKKEITDPKVYFTNRDKQNLFRVKNSTSIKFFGKDLKNANYFAETHTTYRKVSLT